MSEKPNNASWKIFSGQRSVPIISAGKHNYLLLQDPSGKVQAEIHGTTTDSPISGKLAIEEIQATYDEKGRRTNANPYNLGDEDRTTWIEIPAKQGATVLETWEKLKMAGEQYNMRYDYRMLPSGKTPRLGDTRGQFYETMPTYNSNSAWRTILEDNGYDWERYHPKEGTFSISPGDGHRLPPINRTPPPRSGKALGQTAPSAETRCQGSQKARGPRTGGPATLEGHLRPAATTSLAIQHSRSLTIRCYRCDQFGAWSWPCGRATFLGERA